MMILGWMDRKNQRFLNRRNYGMRGSIGECIACQGRCHLRKGPMPKSSTLPSQWGTVVPTQVVTVDERRIGSWKIGPHFVARLPPYDLVSWAEMTVQWRSDRYMALLVLQAVRTTHL